MRHQRTLIIASAAALAAAAASAAAAADRLLFWDSGDLINPAGSLTFGAEKLHREFNITGFPDMQYATAVPRADGGRDVYGWKLTGNAPQRQIDVTRITTADGLSFTSPTGVTSQTQPNAQGFANILQRPTDGNLFLFSWAAGTLQTWRNDGAATTPWLLQGNAYGGHDAMNIIWLPSLGKFLNYQTALQPYNKPIPDNIGNYRRVLSFKTSSDGLHWQDEHPAFLNGGTLWTPDSSDPPDLEFYRTIAFEHQGRYAMLLKHYTSTTSGQHAPMTAISEWAISRDGLNWGRPFRDLNATEEVQSLPVYERWAPVQGPLDMGGKLRFYRNGSTEAMSIDDDRIFYVTSAADSQFTTASFVMPATGLFLNANASAGAYVKADLLNAAGQVIPGFDSSRSLLQDRDGHALPILWDRDNASDLAGQTVSLRIHSRGARLYAIDYADRRPASVAPRSYWRMEEPAGTAVADSGRSPADTGTLLAGATRSSVVFSPTLPLDGAPNTRSLLFNGVDGAAVTMGAFPFLDAGTGDFTLEAWIYPRNADGFGLIAGKLISGLYGDNGFDLHIRPKNEQPGATLYNVQLEARDPDGGGSDGGAGFSVLSGDLAFNQWHHVAGVRKGSQLKLYIDGLLVGNAALSGAANFTSSQEFTVGGGRQGDGAYHRPFNGYIDEVRFSDVALLPSQLLNAARQAWNRDGGGSWSGPANWTTLPPDGNTAVARFGRILSSPAVITLDQPRTACNLVFDSPLWAYTIAGPATLTIDAPPSYGGMISVLSGAHAISAPLALTTNCEFYIQSAGSTLTISGVMSSAPGVQMSKSGPGSLELPSIRAAGLTIADGTVRILPNGTASGTSKLGALDIAGGANPTARLDLGDNDLVIDYASASPLKLITAQIIHARAEGWTGNGIGSSAAAADPAHTLGVAEASALGYSLFSGQPVDGTSVLIKYTWGGDANLDGKVDVVDLGLLATHWQRSGTWIAGDFDYSGFIDVVDLGILAGNWQAGARRGAGLSALLGELHRYGLPSAGIPEPSCGLVAMILSAASLHGRQLRR